MMQGLLLKKNEALSVTQFLRQYDLDQVRGLAFASQP